MPISHHRRALTLGSGLALLGAAAPMPALAAPAPAPRLRRGQGHARSTIAAGTGLPAPAAALTADEIALIVALVGTVVPADRSPSAVELGSADYVVAGLSLGSAESLQAVRQGLAAIDHLALQHFGAPFARLGEAHREILADLVSKTPQLAPLWFGVRNLGVLHYYAQPAAYLDLGLPGPSIDRGGFPDPNRIPCRG